LAAEVCVVELAGGELYLSYRMNSRATGHRHWARSLDGGETISEHGQHQELICRGLHAGLAWPWTSLSLSAHLH
jgi:hypothetical protein